MTQLQYQVSVQPNIADTQQDGCEIMVLRKSEHLLPRMPSYRTTYSFVLTFIYLTGNLKVTRNSRISLLLRRKEMKQSLRPRTRHRRHLLATATAHPYRGTKSMSAISLPTRLTTTNGYYFHLDFIHLCQLQIS